MQLLEKSSTEKGICHFDNDTMYHITLAYRHSDQHAIYDTLLLLIDFQYNFECEFWVFVTIALTDEEPSTLYKM